MAIEETLGKIAQGLRIVSKVAAQTADDIIEVKEYIKELKKTNSTQAAYDVTLLCNANNA